MFLLDLAVQAAKSHVPRSLALRFFGMSRFESWPCSPRRPEDRRNLKHMDIRWNLIIGIIIT